MVDLKLEALGIEDTGKDLYIAVRVGEAQKLSRLAEVRNYKFTQAVIGDRKFARVDLFRRVGTTSVSIKNAEANDSVEEATIRVPDQNPLKFKVHLKPESQEKRKTQAEKLSHAETNVKVVEAKHYLLEHNLEDRLSQAMQGVLRDRPQDPGQYIADLLRRTANDYAKLPKPTTASTPVVPTSVATPAATPLLSNQAWSHRPSVGTWLSSRAWSQKPSIGAGLGRPTSTSLPRMLPEASSSSSSLVLELRAEASEVMVRGAKDGTLQKVLQETSQTKAPMPAVLQLRAEASEVMVRGAKNGTLQKVLEETLETKARMPGVLQLRAEATEVMVRGAKDGTLQKVLEETLQTKVPMPGGQSIQAKAEALRQEAKDTIMQASKNGNLESTLQDAIAAVRSNSTFSGKPSVGTWLMPRRTKKAETVEEPSTRPLAMLPLQCLYGTGFASTGIRPNFVFR